MSLFRFDEDEGYLYLVSHPTESGFPASASQLIELIEDSPYADCEILDANVGQLFNGSEFPEKDSLAVGRAVNAFISIKVLEDNMLAEAHIRTARGGKMVNMHQAKRALRDAGVKKGVNVQALDALLGLQFEKSPGEEYSGIVAHGQSAKDGDDARFIRLCMTAQDRVLSPQEKSGGKVDMRDLGAIITVKPGSPLMKKIPATKGEKGYTVFGDIIEPTPGKDADLEISDGTKLDSKNHNLLIADSKGVPVAIPRGIRVDDVLCYENIDVSTGHVEFDGSVIVSGDVKDGMKVKATGDVTVIGFVESAHIECEGALTIVLGVIGRKRADPADPFSCILKSRRNLSVGYAQYCHIESEQDILIERQALHCDLSARRLIKVGKGEIPRGKLIGGNVLDAMRIETGELGAPSGTKTRIAIAQGFDSLQEKHKSFLDLEKALASKAVAISQAKAKAIMSPASRKRDEYIAKLEQREKQISQHYARNQRNIKLVQQKIARMLRLSRVTVNELMHPGTEVCIAKDKKSFSRIYPPNYVKLHEGKITQQFTTSKVPA
ncbi:DUF342 domain-containing protein [Pseudoalteromonas sp. T1lg65]|uniref:DUF342 domain-containing protein n=1 Tax=Pseudoalteromonas sp. T1lg65 TaxID=2077101 RepID=UPI003F7A32AC